MSVLSKILTTMRCANANKKLRITVAFDMEAIGPEIPSLFTITNKKTEMKNNVKAKRGWGFLEINPLFSSSLNLFFIF
mgnify:CR=1 FL=1